MSLTPNRADLADYLDMMFGYLEPGEENFCYAIALRGLGEKGTDREGAFNDVQILPPLSPLGVDQIFGHVCRWSANHRACFIVPAAISPRALSDKKATEDRILQFTALVADVDKGDTAAKLAHASKYLGTPSMVVHSGGVTETGAPKLHIYWRLTEPSAEVARIALVRKELALKLGGDAAFGRSTQVIRIPGSVYSKNNVERPCLIAAKSQREFELEELAASVAAMPCAEGIQLDTSLLGRVVGSSVYANGHGLNFAAFKAAKGDLQSEKTDLVPVLTQDIHEGGEGDKTRWSNFNVAAGLHIFEARTGRITLDQAKAATVAWMETHMVPPWPMQRFNTEWNALVEKDLREKGPIEKPKLVPAVAQSTQVETAPKDLKMVRGLDGSYAERPALSNFFADRWADVDKPDRKFLVSGLIMAGKPHLLAAEGGAGKTFLLIDLGAKIAMHTPDKLQSWCGMPLADDAGGTVVMFTTEDDDEELHIRLKEILTPAQFQQIRKKLVIVPTMSIGGAFQLVERERYSGAPQLGERWRNWLDQLHGIADLQLVIIDTLNTTLHGEENSATVINEYVQAACADICGKLGAALIITHHIRKPGANTKIYTPEDMKHAIRGSTALIGAFRGALGFWHAPDFKQRMERLNEEPQTGRLFNFAVIKANNPEMNYGTRTLLRQPSGLLVDVTEKEQAVRNVDDAETIAAWAVKAVEYAAEMFHPFTTTDMARDPPKGRKHQTPFAIRDLTREKIESLIGFLLSEEGGKRLVLCKPKGASRYSHLDVPGGPMASNVGDNGGGYAVRDGADFKAPDWEALFVPHVSEDLIVEKGHQFDRTPYANRAQNDAPQLPKLDPNAGSN